MVIEWTDTDQAYLSVLIEKKKRYDAQISHKNTVATIRAVADKIESGKIVNYTYHTKGIFAIHRPGELKYPPRVGEEISLTVKVYG